MREPRAEALRWLLQAENDLAYARPLELEESLRRELAILDQYYIPTRYPNGLPGGLPFEVYTAEQAAAAVATCDRLIALARALIPAE